MRSAFALRIFSGNIVFNFGFQESLRTFLKPFFTGGVATANSSYSTAFYESAALREMTSPSQSPLDSFPHLHYNTSKMNYLHKTQGAPHESYHRDQLQDRAGVQRHV